MVAGQAAALTRFAPGTQASFLYRPWPTEVVLDLAVQAAGLVGVPRPPGLEGQPGHQVEIDGETVVLPSWEEAARSGAAEPAAERLAAGGVVVQGAVLSQGDLSAAAERLGRQIPGLPEGRRHIVVLGGFAGDPAERALLSWATVENAAILLEPEPAHLVPTAVWARPTVFAGPAADRARLREEVEGSRPFLRKRRLPFGRLRAVLATDGDLPSEENAFWEARGVAATPFAAERQKRGI